MKKLLITILSVILAVLLVSCSSPISETDTTQKLTGTETTAETTTAEETKTTERVTDIAIETETSEEVTTTAKETVTTEEVTTTAEESGTESEKVDVKELEAEIQKLWKIKSADKSIGVSNMKFLFENGVIFGGSAGQFKHEFQRCGTYKISDFGELECTFFSMVFGTSSTVVYEIVIYDTGDSMTLYCESCIGTSYFAGRENDTDYTLYFVLTDYPSESKSNDAKLKGNWVSFGHEEMEYIDILYNDGFGFVSFENGEEKRGTWKGYSGVLILTYKDGTVRTLKYELDKNCKYLILSSGKEFYVKLEKIVPCY